jgi:rRNA maturation RNase YbeY
VIGNEINFFNEEINFTLPQKGRSRDWIKEIFRREKRKDGVINIVFCSDYFLLGINEKYLSHNTFTDVITFDLSTDKSHINADIYISIERIKENSKTFKSSFKSELYRVMCHGILHLIGYNDKSPDEAFLIREREDFYLSLLPKFIR